MLKRTLKKTELMSVGLALLISSCSAQGPSAQNPASKTAEGSPQTREELADSTIDAETIDAETLASVTAVETSESGAAQYSFAVTVQSPDTGCDAYANWWEVITPDGELLYRRILAHSHVDEQPFSRSGGPVAVGMTDEVIVRAHMHPTGYSTQAMQGTPTEGFTETILPEDFAAGLAEAEPQPSGCTF